MKPAAFLALICACFALAQPAQEAIGVGVADNTLLGKRAVWPPEGTPTRSAFVPRRTPQRATRKTSHAFVVYRAR
jgi:hypothetical protein